MKGWLFLVIAIVGEVIATSALKSSEGFTKGSAWKTESMVTPVFATPILTTSWLA